MKERPILFSGPMVRATLEGRKTQTRRAVKITHRTPGLAACLTPTVGEPRPRVAAELCPYGQPGERLWVRETFLAYGRWVTRFSAKKGRDEWHFIDMTTQCDRAYQYASDNPDVPLGNSRGALPGWHPRPSIYMPRCASRILLEITGVRVERLHDISDDDACAEGITSRRISTGDARKSFADLWQSINGADSWDENPWVWAIEFKRGTQ